MLTGLRPIYYLGSIPTLSLLQIVFWINILKLLLIIVTLPNLSSKTNLHFDVKNAVSKFCTGLIQWKSLSYVCEKKLCTARTHVLPNLVTSGWVIYRWNHFVQTIRGFIRCISKEPNTRVDNDTSLSRIIGVHSTWKTSSPILPVRLYSVFILDRGLQHEICIMS